jgi:hypothetical protein
MPYGFRPVRLHQEIPDCQSHFLPHPRRRSAARYSFDVSAFYRKLRYIGAIGYKNMIESGWYQLRKLEYLSTPG